MSTDFWFRDATCAEDCPVTRVTHERMPFEAAAPSLGSCRNFAMNVAPLNMKA